MFVRKNLKLAVAQLNLVSKLRYSTNLTKIKANFIALINNKATP